MSKVDERLAEYDRRVAERMAEQDAARLAETIERLRRTEPEAVAAIEAARPIDLLSEERMYEVLKDPGIREQIHRWLAGEIVTITMARVITGKYEGLARADR